MCLAYTLSRPLFDILLVYEEITIFEALSNHSVLSLKIKFLLCVSTSPKKAMLL